MASTTMPTTRAQEFVYVPGIEAVHVVATPPWKRAMDICGALFGIVILSPLFALICLAVIAESRGGAIYRQARVGHGGKVFTCWKFRSMKPGADLQLPALMQANQAEGLIFKMANDPRRTRAGKILRRTSLDELPQLWNVLRGDMSLVGPRPPTVPEVLRYDPRHLHRLAAQPGMTGLWQVTLRRVRHDFSDMIELDTRYARDMSLRLDLEILLKTVPTVLFGRGSY